MDDVLIHDRDLLTYLYRINSIRTRCRENGITFGVDKFVLAEPEIKFCGYVLSAEGISDDPNKVQAITDFVPPANIADLRSFMGLLNQLSVFFPDISSAAQPPRPLMSPQRMFTWTADHDAAFHQVKAALTSPPHLPTILQTDASRISGIGYSLLQDYGWCHFRLVQCGSRFLSDAEIRYATIELEMLATVWAMQKSSFFMRGLHHFEYITNYHPLIPTLNPFTLNAVENRQLQQLKESIFTARWYAGMRAKTSSYLMLFPCHRVNHPNEDNNIVIGILI